MTQEKKYKMGMNDFLFSVRLLSLFLAFIAYIRSYYAKIYIGGTNFSQVAYSLLLTFVVINLLYLSISNVYLNPKRKSIILYKWLECILLTVIFFGAIFVTGIYSSQYKILFIFIIISYTLDFGLKTGLLLSSAISLLLLTIDLIFAPVINGVNNNFQNDILLSAVFIITAWALGFYSQSEREYIASLKDQIKVDSLTLLYNHHAFHENFPLVFQQSRDDNNYLSLIFIDIDYFKTYNDYHGHQFGDNVLKKIAAICLKIAGDRKFVYRYAGDEFAIVLPLYDLRQAKEMAENIRKEVEDAYFEGEELLPNANLTISCGVSTSSSKFKNSTDFVNECYDTLNHAKFFKKNRVETHSSLLEQLSQYNGSEELQNAVTSVKTLIAVVNSRDYYTYGHTHRVAQYANSMAEALGLSRRDSEKLVYAAYLHDVGKVNISKEILLNPNILTDAEKAELNKHPAYSAEIAHNTPGMEDVSDIVLQHHERYDGKGYPAGLKGTEIHYLARVLNVVDSFDAMISIRPYKTSKTLNEAIRELKACEGSQFDPDIAEVFISALANINLP